MGYLDADVLMIDDIVSIWASGGSMEELGAYFSFLLILAERKPILLPRSETTSQVPKSYLYAIIILPFAIEFSSSGLYPN